MSRTREGNHLIVADLKRRSLRSDVTLRTSHHSPDRSSEANGRGESVDETGDILKVDDGSNSTNGTGKKHLYPDLSELLKEESRFVLETDEHGTRIAGEYTRTHIQTAGETEGHSEDFLNMPTESDSFNFQKIVCVVIVLLVAIAAPYYYYYYYYIGTVKEPTRPISQVAEIVNKLKKEHVNQPNLSFRIIKKALESVLMLKNMSEPSAPAVLLLMSTKGAKRETDSFAELLAELVASGNGNYQTIYGNQLQAENPDEAKKEIDDLIKGAPKYNRQMVVLIRDLDVIPSKAVMMLHAYCDHENAPFKNAVFIMTITTDTDIINCESRYFDEAAELHLTKMWGDLGEDMLSALLSRITVSVAAIYHKTKPTVCK